MPTIVTDRAYRYPPDVVLDSRFGSFSRLCVVLIAVAAVVDLALVGFPETGIPYNYPFFVTIVLLLATVAILRWSHSVMWQSVDELARIARRNRTDPLSLPTDADPEAIRTELTNVLFLGYHPASILVGAVVSGSFLLGVMAVTDVFTAYPYRLMNFGVGAAHGAFFGPVFAILYIVVRGLRNFIIDIDLMDPDGVGGYRKIGNGIVTMASYSILLITIDFVIVSSVTFTPFTDFQVVVTGIYLVLLTVVLLGAITITSLVRRRLLDIRDRKVERMQMAFNRQEHAYWEKQQQGEGLTEAVHILAMQAMFHQLNRMNLWPINLPSLLKLAASVGFSLLVFFLDHTNALF